MPHWNHQSSDLEIYGPTIEVKVMPARAIVESPILANLNYPCQFKRNHYSCMKTDQRVLELLTENAPQSNSQKSPKQIAPPESRFVGE